jgi:hypothetical protein
MLQYAFMQRALLAAVLVGVTAPTVGVHLVQRRLALIGDGSPPTNRCSRPSWPPSSARWRSR